MLPYSKWKITAGFLMVLVGLPAAAYGTGVIQKPEFGLSDRGDWKSVGASSVSIVSTGYVYNPNSFGINLSSLDVAYRLRMNGIALAEGGKKGLHIGAERNNTINVETELQPGKVPKWWASHLSRGEKSRVKVPLNAELKVLSYPVKLTGHSFTKTIETDIESKLDRAFSKMKGTYTREFGPAGVAETSIEIVDASGRWGRVTRETTVMLVDVRVRNPNSYPIPVPQMTGDLVMNSVKVASWDANDVTAVNTASGATIAPGETQEITLKVKMDNDKIDEWFVSHARKSERTQGRIDAKLLFDISGNRFAIPSGNGLRCGFSFRTAILVDDQESGGSFDGCNFSGATGSSSGGSGSLTDTDTTDSNDTGSDLGGLLG